jgi:hypothetical protein
MVYQNNMSLLISEAVKSIPHQLKQGTKYDLMAVARETRVFNADRTEYSYNSNPMISCKIPAQGVIDFERSAFQFMPQWDGGELLVDGASLFSLIDIRVGGHSICKLEGADILNSVLSDFTLNNDQKKGAFNILRGTGDTTQRSNWTNGKIITIQPLLELLRYARYLPLSLLGEFEVQFYLTDPRVCFKHTGNVSYKITDAKYVCDVVKFRDEVEEQLIDAWKQDRLRFHYKEWIHQRFSSQDQQTTLTINNTYDSVDAVLVVPRKASVTTSQNADSYERTFSDLEQYEVNLGLLMNARVNCGHGGSAPYWELQKVLDFSEQISVTPGEWTSTKFVMGANLQVVSGNPDGISGYSGRGSIVINLYRSNIPSEPIVYDVFMLVDRVLMAGQTLGTRVY